MMNRHRRFFRSGLLCAATAVSLALGGCAPGEGEPGAYNSEQGSTAMYAERVYSEYQVAAKGRIWLSVSTLQSGALSDIADRSVNETLGVPDYWIQMDQRGMDITALRREQRAEDMDEWSVPVLLTHFNELGRPVSEGRYRLLSVQVMMDTVRSEHKVLEACWEQQGECVVMDPVLLQADSFSRDRKALLMAGWAPSTSHQAAVVMLDAGMPIDAGVADAGIPDAGPLFPDNGGSTPTTEGEGSDAGTSCPIDAGNPDAGNPDAGIPDAGIPDAGIPDAGIPFPIDAGTVNDAGTVMAMMAPPACKKCTLDSNPEWARKRTNYPAYTRNYRNVYGITMVSKSMGAQEVGVACAVVGDACKSSGFGSSAASSCWTNLPFTCACDNTGNQAGNSADGSATRSWAETKCTHRLVLDATVKWTKEGKDSEFTIKWETSGSVDANGGQMFDSCSWK
ncbi:hypothetical protein [Archangium violaceum]|uniref:hypothetical protein n=1 Tax=Archangium violaceum TaxID=83451 RepID=UPI0036D777C8